MVVDTIKESLSINKLVSSKKEIIFVEGDMIVPDTKPDILNTICTSGVVNVYSKEILDDKIKISGSINTYIMYMPESSEDKVRGISTNVDFSEIINVANCKEGMDSIIDVKLKTIECKVINGRKIGIKATLEVDIKIYNNDEIELINDIQNADEVQMLKENLNVNSLVGKGDTKIYAKDTIAIDNIDNLAEILKTNIDIVDRDIKISYNKVLTKAEAEVKIMYLTEDNRINIANAKIPVVGFIDIQNVTEENSCDVHYEIRNMIIKPNQAEEHSIYVEIEVGVTCTVYEEKRINIIQDIYSPCENLEYNKKQITTMKNKRTYKITKQIREKVQIENLDNRTILDVDVLPTITKESRLKTKILYEGELELRFIISNSELNIDTKTVKIPFDYVLDNLENGEELNINTNMEIQNKDFIIQHGGNVTSNIDMQIEANTNENANLTLIDELQSSGEREEQDYNIVMYIVKKGDTLWEIAKKFGSTVDEIARTNGVEDVNMIMPGQKIYIPRYTHKKVAQNQMVSHV